MKSGPTNPSLKVFVFPEGDRWVVKVEGAKSPPSLHSSRAVATRAAEKLLGESGGVLQVRDASGQIREGYVVGSEPMTKMNAVEGIYAKNGKRRTK